MLVDPTAVLVLPLCPETLVVRAGLVTHVGPAVTHRTPVVLVAQFAAITTVPQCVPNRMSATLLQDTKRLLKSGDAKTSILVKGFIEDKTAS